MNCEREGKDFIGVGGGVLIVNEKDEILLMRRARSARNEAGLWSKPGGTVDYGERVADALIRELKEELNVDIEMIGYLPHVDHFLPDEKQHWVAFNYIARIIGGELRNRELHKCDKVAWFACDNLPENITQTTQEPIENYMAKKYIRI